jgi:hypothetical protein
LRPFSANLRNFENFSVKERTDSNESGIYEALRGRPWNPCDWRGLLALWPDAKYGNAALEGPRQFWKLLMVRWGLEKDYACEDATFGASDDTKKARANMCALYAKPDEKEEGAE